MTKRSDSEASAQQIPNWMPADFLKFGRERTDALLAMQKELLNTYEQASQAWLSRVKSEADLWSELATKLSGTKSVPEAVSAYQQTILQRMQMASEDGHRLSDETQKVMKTITASLSNGAAKTTS